MKKTALLLTALFMAFAFSGCGGGGGGGSTVVVVPTVVTVLSDQALDGDITRDSATGGLGAPIFADTAQNVLSGIVYDQLTGGEISETRGFLNFTLTGTTVPVDPARITFASLSIFVNSVTPTPADPVAPIPFFIDLIDTGLFPPPIVSTDFEEVPFSSISVSLSGANAGAFAEFDVTPLLQDALSLGLTDFEIRIRFDRDRFQTDLSTIRGLVEIDDSDNVAGHLRADFAPLLHVEFL